MGHGAFIQRMSNATVGVRFSFLLRLFAVEALDDKCMGLGVQPQNTFGLKSVPLSLHSLLICLVSLHPCGPVLIIVDISIGRFSHFFESSLQTTAGAAFRPTIRAADVY